MTNDEDIKLALLIQKVEQIANAQDQMKKDLDALKNSALRISGGLALIVIVASVIGWVVGIMEKIHIK